MKKSDDDKTNPPPPASISSAHKLQSLGLIKALGLINISVTNSRGVEKLQTCKKHQLYFIFFFNTF